MISFSEAQSLLRSHLLTLEPVRVPLDRCLGQVVARPAVSDIDMPPFDKSAMDGYAVRSADLAGIGPGGAVPLRLAGEVAAGAVSDHVLETGECLRIFTGAPVPAGADAVVMVEDTEAAGEEVLFHRPVRSGQHICPRGQDITEGQTVVEAGTVVTPAVIGVLAAVGIAEPWVHPAPRVAILATGNEIVPVDQVPAPGQIRNSNAPTLAAQARLAGCEVELVETAGDDEAALRDALARGLAHDILILSGGVSVGKYDLVKAALRDAGVKLVFEKVRIKPGKPVVFGLHGRNRRIFGLPGNPVSAFVTFELFVRPMILSMQGHPVLDNPVVAARLGHAAANRSGRRSYVPARVRREGNGAAQVTLLEYHGSADLQSLVGANALAILPEVVSELPAGAPCEAMLLPATAISD
ncbi:MAG: molybdopterin molybdotransferase MoeA [Nitrospirota bacterium]|jgi:molybdenum cofactor synthesis domain-containing protein